MRKVAVPSPLYRRGNVFWFRKRVPKDAAHAFDGKADYWRSLSTSDPVTARQRLVQVEREFQRRVDDARRRRPLATQTDQTESATPRRPTIAELERIVRAWLPDYWRRTEPRGRRIDRREMRQSLELEAAHLEACLFDGVLPLQAEWLARHFVEEHGLDLRPADPVWSDLVQLTVRAKLEAVRREIERLSNKTGMVHDAELFGPDRYTQDERRASGQTITLGEAMDQFIAEKALSLKGKTITLYRARVQIIADALGRERLLHEITRDDCRRVRDEVIVKLPAHFRRRFPTAEIQQAIEIAQKQGLPRYSRATQSLFVEVMATFFRWAIDHELIERDPAKGLRLSRGGDEERKAFDTAQIKKLLSAPVFTGAKTDKQLWTKPGEVLIADHRYWVPLIALYSGMRLNEICQLLISDVIDSGGVVAFDIRPSKRAGKSVKTKAGHRQVPVHPVLMQLGFAAYFEAQKQAGHNRSMFRRAPGGNLAVEGGLTLLYTLAGNGAVAVILYPAGSDIARPLEDHLFLAVRRLTGHELLSRLEQDLRYLIAYGHVTSIDAHPTLGERVMIWWLRQSQPKQVQGSYKASELSQAAGKVAGSFGGSLLGAVLRPLVWIGVGVALVAGGWPHLAEWLK